MEEGTKTQGMTWPVVEWKGHVKASATAYHASLVNMQEWMMSTDMINSSPIDTDDAHTVA